ncbi:universal stress protein [Chloroflexota bacterium]
MYNHIMVPLDGSELAECVLPHVEAISSGCSVVRVTLARIIPPFHLHDYAEEKLPHKERERLENQGKENAGKYLENIAKQLKIKGIQAETVVLAGSTVPELVDYTSKNDVGPIVISTHGRSGFSELFLGSTADKLLQSSRVPVLMVRAPRYPLPT